MNEELARLHGIAAMKCGRANSCTGKVKHTGYIDALKTAKMMKEKKNADLEPYPCVFCGGWHIGRTMTMEEVQAHAKGR